MTEQSFFHDHVKKSEFKSLSVVSLAAFADVGVSITQLSLERIDVTGGHMTHWCWAYF